MPTHMSACLHVLRYAYVHICACPYAYPHPSYLIGVCHGLSSHHVIFGILVLLILVLRLIAIIIIIIIILC